MLGSGARPHKRSKVPSLSPFVWDQNNCCCPLRPTHRPLPRVMPLLLFPLFMLASSHLPHISYTAGPHFPGLSLGYHLLAPGV